MTVKQLIEKLSSFEDDKEIVFSVSDMDSPYPYLRLFSSDIAEMAPQGKELVIILDAKSNNDFATPEVKDETKAVIIKHKNPDDTGMIHLCDSAYYDHEEKGRDKRKRLFPIGTEVTIKPAHFYGSKQVFKATNEKGDKDYFCEEEIGFLG